MRNSLICYTIQQKIYETHKIWHPREQNYFFVHFNQRQQNFQGVYKNFGNSGGEGGINFEGRFWKIQRGGGVLWQIPSVGGGGYGYFLEPHIITITCQRILTTIITLLHFLHCSGYHLRFEKQYPLLLFNYKEGGIDILQVAGVSNMTLVSIKRGPREDKGDREGIPHTHPIPQVIRLELFLESGLRAAWMFRGGFA